MAPKKLKQ